MTTGNINVRDVLDGTALLLAAVTVLLRACGLAEKPWAKPIVALSTDIAGAFKKKPADPGAP